MPKIDKDLQARMEELGMDFVLNPPPPLPQKPQIVSEELILGPRKIQEIVVPQFEKDLAVIIDPSLDSDLFRKYEFRGAGRRVAYIKGDTVRMGRETADYIEEHQSLNHVHVIAER